MTNEHLANPYVAVLVVGLGIATAQTKQVAKTDTDIKQEIIKQSIALEEAAHICSTWIALAGCADAGVRTVGPDGLRGFAMSEM